MLGRTTLICATMAFQTPSPRLQKASPSRKHLTVRKTRYDPFGQSHILASSDNYFHLKIVLFWAILKTGDAEWINKCSMFMSELMYNHVLQLLNKNIWFSTQNSSSLTYSCTTLFKIIFSDICQVRLDFETFEIAGPNSPDVDAPCDQDFLNIQVSIL